MRAFLILIFLIGLVCFALLGVSSGYTTLYSAGFLVCLFLLVLSIGSLGSKQGGGRLNKTRPKQF